MPAFMLCSGSSLRWPRAFWVALCGLGGVPTAVRAVEPPCPPATAATVTADDGRERVATSADGTFPAGARAAPAGTVNGAAAAEAHTSPAGPISGTRATVTPTTPASPENGTPPADARASPAVPVNGNPEPIEASSDKATVDVNGDAYLQGHVQVRQGTRRIRANDVQYDATRNAFRVEGGVVYEDPAVQVSGGAGHYSATEGADFKSAEFELRQRSARGAADTMQLSPTGVMTLKDVSFTTCPANDRSWQIRADSITLDTRTRLGTGRDARVDFQGVPIFYLPWMSFPLGTERKSGFLFPSIGHTTRSGVQFNLPYYWNIAPNADFTFEPTEYQLRGIDLAGELRYLAQNQHGTLNFSYLPRDRLAQSDRNRLKLEHVTDLPEDFRFRINAESVSDAQYFEDFGQGPEGTSVAFLERLAGLTYRDEHWRLAAQVQQFQTIDLGLADIDRPYARLPRLVAGAEFGWGPQERFHYGFDSELVNFHRSVGVTGWRLDTMPTASLDLAGAGYFIRPGVAWRYTQYALSETAPGQRTNPTRSLPIASLDTGLIFERESGAEGQRRLTLEPRLLYLQTPFRAQDDLPLFDTALPDLNLVQLFRTNRYVGVDRVSDAHQVSVGVTSRLFDARSGAQFLSATLGQTYYFRPPRVRLPDETVRTSGNSDFVAQLTVTAYRHWNADFGLQWNPSLSRSERAQVNLQYRPDGEQVVNVGYRFQRDVLEQTEVSAAWPLGGRWALFSRYVYSLRDDKSLERFAALEYRSCCWRLRAGGRRFVSSRTGQQDVGLYLQLELTGLASVGSAADAFLAGAIRGYARPETAH